VRCVTSRPANVLLAACALINILPLFAGRFLPFSDLPEHTAAIAAFGQWSDPSFRIDEHYSFAFGESQYLLYHALGALLAKVVGSAERANLVLIASTGLAWPYAARAFLRALGRDERLALFACPLFWNHALVIGLLPFVASVPLVLFGLALALRTPRASVVGAVAVILFFAHVQGFAMFALALVAITLSDPERAARPARRKLLGLAPAFVVAALWLTRTKLATRGSSLDAPQQLVFATPSMLARGFPYWAHDTWRGHADEVLAVAFWIVLLIVAMRGAAKKLSIWMPLGIAVLLFLVVPYRVGGGDMLNVRLAVFVPLFALPLLEPARDRWWPSAVAVVLTVAGAANHAREIHATQTEIGDFDRVLDALPRGARVLSLQFTAESQHTHFPPWVHAVALHRARNGGVAEPSFAVLGHWPIHYREGAAPPKKDIDFWEFHPGRYENAIDGPYYDFVLVRGAVDPFRSAGRGPRWTPIVREGDWTLWRRS
jgi:hypothetical protein